MSDWERVRNRVGTWECSARGHLRRAVWSVGPSCMRRSGGERTEACPWDSITSRQCQPPWSSREERRQTAGDESPCPGAHTHGDHVIMLFSSQSLLLCLLAEVKLNVSPSAYAPPPPTPEHHAVLTPHSHELCDIGKDCVQGFYFKIPLRIKFVRK